MVVPPGYFTQGNVGDIMLGPPFQSLIPLTNFVDSQPNSITIQEENINLEYEFGLDW
ncbi:hypothetical protein [Winogradskyella ursingii]|uniref:hypothetical protein n=1 Tax=Winogradskyella ursingii TaxID=2686079 RepID=UPI0015CD401F|nr:hypothetical protein [Winogradskyella ursingii]